MASENVSTSESPPLLPEFGWSVRVLGVFCCCEFAGCFVTAVEVIVTVPVAIDVPVATLVGVDDRGVGGEVGFGVAGADVGVGVGAGAVVGVGVGGVVVGVGVGGAVVGVGVGGAVVGVGVSIPGVTSAGAKRGESVACACAIFVKKTRPSEKMSTEKSTPMLQSGNLFFIISLFIYRIFSMLISYLWKQANTIT
jgi:hypothetical protein